MAVTIPKISNLTSMTCYKTQTSELPLRRIISDRHLFIVPESFPTVLFCFFSQQNRGLCNHSFRSVLLTAEIQIGAMYSFHKPMSETTIWSHNLKCKISNKLEGEGVSPLPV